MKTKTICVSSVFPATPDKIWSIIGNLDTLRYIAAPYAYFTPLDTSNALVWHKGETTQFYLKVFGIIPMGTHTIKIIAFDKGNYYIASEEKNHVVFIWNHQIHLKPTANGTALYEDAVEIGAGWKTNLVCVWSKMFYRHRQRKWRKLLSRKD